MLSSRLYSEPVINLQKTFKSKKKLFNIQLNNKWFYAEVAEIFLNGILCPY